MGSEEGAGERGENEMIRRYRDKEKDKVMLRGKATEIKRRENERMKENMKGDNIGGIKQKSGYPFVFRKIV